MRKFVYLLLFVGVFLFGSISLKKVGVYGGNIIDMKRSGDFLYLASKNGIGVVSLNDPLNLREISFLSTKNEPSSIFIDSWYGKLYVGFKNGNLKVYSLLDPLSLKLMSEYEQNGCKIEDIKESNGYLYLVCSKKGLVVLDASNNYLFEVGSLKIGGEAKKIIIRGNIAFLLSNFGINVINISNPSKPFIEKKFFISPSPMDMALKDKYLFITNGSHGLLIMDVSNPKLLDWDKQEKFIPTKTSFSKIEIVGNRLFVLEGGAIRAMSIINPLNPLSLFTYKTLSKIENFSLSKDFIYLGVDGAGIESVDISDIRKPKYKARYLGENFYANAMAVRGKYAYIADKFFGVHIADISSPNDIRFVSFMDTNGTVSDISLRGRYAFISVKNQKVLIADILNPNSYKIVSSIDLKSPPTRSYVEDEFLYVAEGKGGFEIFDLSDIENPIKVGEFFSGGYAYNLRVKSGYVFVADGDKGVSIVDVSYPPLPFLENRISIGKRVYDLRVEDSFLFTACDRCFKIFDISDIKNPILKATYNVNGEVRSFDLRDNYALLGIDGEGMQIVSIKDLTNIKREGFIKTSFVRGVKFNYDEAIGAFGRDGLEIYKIYTHVLKPKNVYAFALGMDRAYVFWDRVKEGEGYYITRVEADSGKKTVVAMLDKYSEDFEDFGLSPNTRYYYEVRVSTDFGLSSPVVSNVILTEGGNPPASVSDLKAILKDKFILLTWRDNSDNESAFYVTRHSKTETKIVAILPANSTSFRDDKVKPGEEYWYEVEAVNEFGKSNPVSSQKIIITKINPPAAPSDFKAKISSDDSILLSWKDNSDNEAAFVITRRNPDGSFEKIATLPANTTSYLDKNLTKGIYQYDIAAMNSAGFSKRVLSNSVEIGKEESTTPNAPSDFEAKVLDTNKVKLTWKDNSDNENGFYISRQNKEGEITVIAFVDKDTTEYIDTDVQPGESYIYQIVAVNDNGISKWITSNKVEIKGEGIPKAPSLLTATAKGDKVKLTWQDNSDNEIGFYLERRKKGENPIVIAILDPNTTEFTDEGLKKGVYIYYISAFNDFGVSQKSKSNKVEIK